MYRSTSWRGASTMAFLWLRWLGCLLSVLLASALGSHAAWAQDDFLDPDEAFVMSAAMGTPTRVDVHFQVAPNYYMYQERLAAVLEPDTDASRLGDLVLPPARVQYDVTFEKDMPVYYGQYTLQIPVEPGAEQPLSLTLTSQGCADAGLCYTPVEHVLTLTPTDNGYTLSGEGVVQAVPDLSESTPPEGMQATAAATPSSADDVSADSSLGELINLGDTGLATWLSQASLGKIVLLAFILGLLLSFTPCVLPMVPILLAVLAGGEARPQALSRWRGFSLAAVFVLGMSLVYTILGVGAGVVGASLAVWLQTPWVLSLFAILLGLFALAMFDVYTFQVPAGLQNQLNRRLSQIPGGRMGGVFLMGMLSALIVGPCVAAPLAGVLLFISQTGDLAMGGSALFAMAWGQGMLLLAVGLSSGLLMPKAGPWMQGIKILFGLLLLATAWWMVMPVVPIWIAMLGWALLALMAACFLAGGRKISRRAKPLSFWRVLGQSVAAMLAVWAVVLMVGVAIGSRHLSAPLAPLAAKQAASTDSAFSDTASSQPVFTQIHTRADLDQALSRTSQPVMLDFYADWCVSCIQMEKFTFSDPEVAERMGKFTLIQADVTKNNAEHRALLKRFDLFGPPGIVFFDASGSLLPDARVVGFKDATAFAAVLDRILAAHP